MQNILFSYIYFLKNTTFIQAIYTLQRLKTTFTPAEKLDVIVDVFNAITNEKGESGAGRGFTWNMDVLLPVIKIFKS